MLMRVPGVFRTGHDVHEGWRIGRSAPGRLLPRTGIAQGSASLIAVRTSVHWKWVNAQYRRVAPSRARMRFPSGMEFPAPPKITAMMRVSPRRLLSATLKPDSRI